MHANAWAALLRHIPPEQYSKIMLVTGSGVEIAVQIILRIDHEFLAFKGRMAGSQDQGRLFFVPFHNIDYINFQYAVKDEEFEAMFGTMNVPNSLPSGQSMPAPPVESTPAPAAARVVEQPRPEPVPEPKAEPEPVAAVPVGPSGRTPLPLKSAVLERFRSRTSGGSFMDLPPANPS